jgi:SNW domain-containing protein 1
VLENLSQSLLERPDEEEIEKTKKETQAALDRLVTGKISAQQPKTLPQQPGAPTYIKYTPSQQGPQYNSGASQRIIKMQDMPVDPMEPPKFRHKKVCFPSCACVLFPEPVIAGHGV